MKLFNLVASLFFIMSSGAMVHAEERDVVISVSEAFIPGGFDANSEVYVVASGMFSNSCYRWKGAVVRHTSPNLHEVVATARVSQGMCLMVLVPYTNEIQLGKLGAGEHHIRFLNGDGTYMEKVLTLE